MRNNFKIAITILVMIIFGSFIYYFTTNHTPANQGTPVVTEDSIKGCYIAHLAKDVYTLTILSQDGESFNGKLSFKNFEKDSSSGTYVGTYKNEILLGDYSFNSEGMDSVMQVIFKKSGNSFIRGYGDLNREGTRFVDLNKITYDNSQIFEAQTDCTNSFTITYNNTDYGFTFSLPSSWQGYSVVKNTWEGNSLVTGGKKQTGPKLLIRNPNWTQALPYEDIPVLVFTQAQWASYIKEEFAVSAAPIAASELGHNNAYVFALPPRWDFDYSKGYEEAQNILKMKPLKTYSIKLTN